MSSKRNKFTLLGGRTGHISKISDHEGIITDKIYGDIVFNEDVLKLSIKGRKGGFRSCFYINQVVYFDLEIDDFGTGVCRGVWIGRKELPNFGSDVTEPIFATTKPKELMERMVYKGTVTKMRPPYAFIVELEESKIPVFVFNQAFKPAHDAPKLSRDEPVSLYVSKGDTVYVTVYKNSPEKEFKWSAWVAWMEDDNISVTSTCSEESHKTKKRRRRKRTKTGEKNDILKGKLCFVGSKTAQLDSKEHGSVFFHRDNTFLFGIPLRQLSLDAVFKKGEELNYIMSDKNEGEASCVWFGSQDAAFEDVKERMVSIIKYCQTRGIEDASVLTILAHELHKQWSPFKEEQKHIEKEDETYDCSVTREYKRTIIENNVSKEVNTDRGSEFKVNQANLNHQDQNSTKTNVDANVKNKSSTPSSQIQVKESESFATIKTENKQTASLTTNIRQIQNCESDQSNICSAIIEQNYKTLNDFIKEPASVTSTSKNVSNESKEHSNAVGECKKENTELFVSKYGIPGVNENVTITLETQDIACNTMSLPVNLVTGNPSPHISQNSTQSFMSDAKPALDVSANVLEMQNTNDENETQSDVESALDIPADVLEAQHTSDENEPESDLELGLNISENVLEMQHINDQNEKFGVPLINKTVAHNLQLSLMSVLEKEVGKTATQILAPHVIALLEKELTKHVMQELMEKALSSVIDNITEEGTGNVGDMQNTDGEVNGMTKVSTMVQEWKQEIMLIVEQQKSHNASQLVRAKKFQEKIVTVLNDSTSARYCNWEADDAGGGGGDGDDVSGRIMKYRNDNDNKNNISTPEKSSALLGIVQDNMQLQNQTFHHIDRIPRCNEIGSSTKVLRDQESQTVSTGHILYLKYLPDT